MGFQGVPRDYGVFREVTGCSGGLRGGSGMVSGDSGWVQGVFRGFPDGGGGSRVSGFYRHPK